MSTELHIFAESAVVMYDRNNIQVMKCSKISIFNLAHQTSCIYLVNWASEMYILYKHNSQLIPSNSVYTSNQWLYLYW